jgi:phospholipid-binding lipoprotein MlaA
MPPPTPTPCRRPRPTLTLLAALAMFAGIASGCATPPPASDPEALEEFRANNDPIEPTNRVLFEVHEAVDQAVLEPVARAYRAAVPQPARTGVRNVLGNLSSPVIMANDLLQGNRRRAEVTLGRFMINSTVGLAGLIDVASMIGVPGHAEDFGQTLAVWGVGEGPYLFIPILGPSNPRDLSGFLVDVVSNPFNWLGQGAAVEALTYSRAGVTVVDTREALLDTVDDLRRTSLDPYATIRSASRQRRQAEIENRIGPEGIAPPSAGSTGFGAAIRAPWR